MASPLVTPVRRRVRENAAYQAAGFSAGNSAFVSCAAGAEPGRRVAITQPSGLVRLCGGGDLGAGADRLSQFRSLSLAVGCGVAAAGVRRPPGAGFVRRYSSFYPAR